VQLFRFDGVRALTAAALSRARLVLTDERESTVFAGVVGFGFKYFRFKTVDIASRFSLGGREGPEGTGRAGGRRAAGPPGLCYFSSVTSFNRTGSLE
jgi:hypothetical protein